MDENKIDQFKELDEIINAIGNLDGDTLKEVLANIIKVYIIDKGVGYEGDVIDDFQVSSDNIPNNQNDDIRISNFYEFLLHAKKKYPFPELNKFHLANGEAYIILDNQRYKISSESSRRMINPEIEKKEGSKDNKISKKISPDRFKNLEMDKE